jgi:N-methylhydantoinase A
VWIGGEERPAVIYDRARLRQGDVIEGPAIITEMDSTTLVEHDCRAAVDAVGNILITLKAKG